MTELDKALAWSEWFCALIRRSLALHPDGPDDQHWAIGSLWRGKPWLAYRLSNDSEDLLDDNASGRRAIPN